MKITFCRHYQANARFVHSLPHNTVSGDEHPSVPHFRGTILRSKLPWPFNSRGDIDVSIVSICVFLRFRRVECYLLD